MLSITLNPISKTLTALFEVSLCLSRSLATSITNETHNLVEDALGGHQFLIVLHAICIWRQGGVHNLFTSLPWEER